MLGDRRAVYTRSTKQTDCHDNAASARGKDDGGAVRIWVVCFYSGASGNENRLVDCPFSQWILASVSKERAQSPFLPTRAPDYRLFRCRATGPSCHLDVRKRKRKCDGCPYLGQDLTIWRRLRLSGRPPWRFRSRPDSCQMNSRST